MNIGAQKKLVQLINELFFVPGKGFQIGTVGDRIKAVNFDGRGTAAEKEHDRQG